MNVDGLKKKSDQFWIDFSEQMAGTENRIAVQDFVVKIEHILVPVNSKEKWIEMSFDEIENF